jgi:hypothetical protein
MIKLQRMFEVGTVMTIAKRDRIASIDINPLIALPDRAVGVGALIMPVTS